jgi:hypothetical protein
MATSTSTPSVLAKNEYLKAGNGGPGVTEAAAVLQMRPTDASC